MWTVYIMKCKGDSYYTGITKDLNRRISEHTSFKRNKYTTYNMPEKIVYVEEYIDRIQAKNRESQIKRWSRAKKTALINADINQLKELSKSRD